MSPLLHLVWLGDRTPAIEAQHRHFRAMAAGFEVRLHTDDSDLHPDYGETYRRYAHTPQMQSDFLRHSVLQKYGGVYLDFDTTLLVPLGESLRWTDPQRYSFAAMGAVAFYNPDFLTCPADWAGWPTVNEYFRDYRAAALPNLAFAGILLTYLVQTIPEKVHVIRDPVRFATPATATPATLMVRHDKRRLRL